MDGQLEKLITMVKLWLKKNELDGDTSFYTIEEWKARGEDYLNDSEYVIVTEGGLNFILNYGDPEEFYDLVESFGYYYEQGHSWNLGFYKDIWNDKSSVSHKSYSEKLRDERWIKKRNFVRNRANNKCEDCGSTSSLHVHHCYYMYGFEPWEYPYDALRCLCSKCHSKRDLTEKILRGHLAVLSNDNLNSIVMLIERGLYWYPKEDVFKLLQAFKYDQTEMKEVFNKM